MGKEINIEKKSFTLEKYRSWKTARWNSYWLSSKSHTLKKIKLVTHAAISDSITGFLNGKEKIRNGKFL